MTAHPASPSRPLQSLALTPTERERLLDLAVISIEHVLRTGRRGVVDPGSLTPRLLRPGASFVTLRRGSRLLGCIGTLQAYQPLATDVADHAVAAAFEDPRFPGIGVSDFEVMTIDVSVLGPAHPVPAATFPDLLRTLRPGVDGLVVEAAGRRATFLPSVWSQVRGAEEFCALLWRKAGLPPGQFPRGLLVSTYQVDEFERPGPRRFHPATGRSGGSADELVGQQNGAGQPHHGNRP